MAKKITSPAPTVFTDLKNNGRAFILDCQKAGDTGGDRLVTLPQGNEPMFTVTSGKSGKQPVRAWYGRRPIQTPGAFLVNESSTMEFRAAAGSAAAQVASDRNINQRAWLSQGRVVKMTPRALARFQSIPDDYILTGNNKLDCTVIGNGVPPKLYRAIIEGLTE